MACDRLGTVGGNQTEGPMDDFAALERRMAAEGWTWDGDGPDDIEGRFVKPGHLSLTFEGAQQAVQGWTNPGDELRE